MTDIVCKCGTSRLEDVQCAECGAYFKAGWIPASDPPKEDGEYWVWFNHTLLIGSQGYCDYSKNYLKNNGWFCTDPVTYWMPLPPPPEIE